LFSLHPPGMPEKRPLNFNSEALTNRVATSLRNRADFPRRGMAATTSGAPRRHRFRKTFTMARVIRPRIAFHRSRNTTRLSRAALSRIQNFFPENAVENFVSYYDFYQPEAYVRRDVYIEKIHHHDGSINCA